MTSPGLYWRTIRHIRPRQLWTRAARTMVPTRVRPGPAPPLRAASASLVTPVAREDGWVSERRVRLLNLEREFGAGVDWTPSEMPRLWTYALNYFQDLPQSVGTDREPWMSSLVQSWIGGNPPGTRDSWDPYPLSIRILNWVKWKLALDARSVPHGDFADADSGAKRARGTSTDAEYSHVGDAPFADRRDDGDVLDSLALQTRYLEKTLEYDIMANHLFANAVALTVAGLFFGGAEGDRWATKGLDLLARELDEQVLDDGGHFERSPMYHSVVLEQLLDVLNVWSALPDGVPPRWVGERRFFEGNARAMLRWLGVMTHPDGGISFFNDSTLGAAPTHAELLAYAGRLEVVSERDDERPAADAPPREASLSAGASGVAALEFSDFTRLESGDGRTVVLFDAGVPAPDYQPGHAHSESLCLELSRDGRRLFVNSGVSTYEPGDQRSLERSTASHNTLRIDGREQSELWAGHRMGRRAHLLCAGVSERSAQAVHDGYSYLRGAPTHSREVRVDDESVLVEDTVDGGGDHRLEWFFHLHPEVAAELDGALATLTRGGRKFARVRLPEGARPEIVNTTWHPGFNASVPNRTLCATWSGSLPAGFRTIIEWR